MVQCFWPLHSHVHCPHFLCCSLRLKVRFCPSIHMETTDSAMSLSLPSTKNLCRFNVDVTILQRWRVPATSNVQIAFDIAEDELSEWCVNDLKKQISGMTGVECKKFMLLDITDTHWHHSQTLNACVSIDNFAMYTFKANYVMFDLHVQLTGQWCKQTCTVPKAIETCADLAATLISDPKATL